MRPWLIRQRREESGAEVKAPVATKRSAPHTPMVMAHNESTAPMSAPAAAQT